MSQTLEKKRNENGACESLVCLANFSTLLTHTHTYIHKIYSTFELYYIYSHDCFDVVGCLETRFIFIPKDSQSKKQKKTKNTMK